ncbi:amino acid transporter [Viridothelium virens]|uniref:Amino acid transporter n=1 Tax=Viridothelium virens TaxID=1048519 RepID=A0A6A6GYU1_VIRVR|nr:amino acid transporter [Viridothelium virens]
MSSGKQDFELRERLKADQATQKEPKVASQDDQTLLRLGKKPILKRTFGFMSILGFSCTVLITWEGILIVSTQGLLNGGPAGVVWGFLIDWLGMMSTFTVVAELASMAPVAAGQYHWTAMLAPAGSRSFVSYVTAWATIAGWQAETASAAYLIGSLIQGIVVLTHPTYTPQPYQTMLFLWAVLLFALFFNSITSRALARFEGAFLVLHLVGFFAVLIPLVLLGPHGDASSVFLTFLNGGNWSTQALSFFVGLPSPVFALFGADSAVHMSEEIQNASRVVPKALVLSIVINGLLGFAMVLAMLFCIGDLQTALAAQETLFYPFLAIFQQATRSTAGATIMASIVVIMGVASTIGVFATTTRMLWSFARDRGAPGSKFLTKLTTQTSLPVNAVGITTLISMLLSLIILGSSVAFSDIVLLSVVGLYSSYLLVCSLLLWRRLQGSIKPYNESAVFVGPWRVPEPFGTANNIFACIYLALVFFWSFWPPAASVAPASMNYSVLLFGAVMLFSLLWYFFRAREYFKGPIVEIDLASM